ncbi:hypothetical protein [Variovorax ginsengisoli]|uniref:Uncharacterized protein n=1 Tax=Variovorax ginsengisoli TaxID=363844 RepID=A0ABT9S270_9BURK|nr:hypothetical protein [Variovorax ginsengisoli]MDP9898451.1 hypothetical protein [Variovorax ginsengisoli]
MSFGESAAIYDNARQPYANEVINKNDSGDFRESIVEVVSRHVPLRHARPKLHYQPAKILSALGFDAVEESVIPVVEHLSPEQTIAHVRSMRLWEEVPLSFHYMIEAELYAYVAQRLDAHGIFQRPLHVAVAWGSRS